MRKLLPVVLIFFLFTGAKCKKDRDIVVQLPPETQTGANTFGCRINGEIFIPKGFGNCYSYDVQYYTADSTLLIKTNNTCVTGLDIYLYRVSGERDYQIFNPIDNSFLYSNSNPNTNCDWFDRANSIQTGTVTITKFDLVNKIVSGRFEGVLKISGCPDINLTAGRFDFKMSVYN